MILLTLLGLLFFFGSALGVAKYLNVANGHDRPLLSSARLSRKVKEQ